MQKRWILGTVFLCMIGTGVVYAGWTKSLSVDMHIKLGEMKIELPREPDAYRVEILDKKGKTIEKMWTDEVEIQEDGGLKLYFGKRHPVSAEEWFDSMESIRFWYPLLEQDGNSIEQIQAVRKEEVKLICKSAWIKKGTKKQELEQEEYKKVAPPMVWRDTRTLEKEGNNRKVIHRLELTKESKKSLMQAQEEALVWKSGDKNEKKEKAKLYTVYTFETDLVLQQKQEAAEKKSHIAYAYWTNQFRIEGEIELCRDMILQEAIEGQVETDEEK